TAAAAFTSGPRATEPASAPFASKAAHCAASPSASRMNKVSAKLLDSQTAKQRPRDAACVALQDGTHRELICTERDCCGQQKVLAYAVDFLQHLWINEPFERLIYVHESHVVALLDETLGGRNIDVIRQRSEHEGRRRVDVELRADG